MNLFSWTAKKLEPVKTLDEPWTHRNVVGALRKLVVRCHPRPTVIAVDIVLANQMQIHMNDTPLYREGYRDLETMNDTIEEWVERGVKFWGIPIRLASHSEETRVDCSMLTTTERVLVVRMRDLEGASE